MRTFNYFFFIFFFFKVVQYLWRSLSSSRHKSLDYFSNEKRWRSHFGCNWNLQFHLVMHKMALRFLINFFFFVFIRGPSTNETVISESLFFLIRFILCLTFSPLRFSYSHSFLPAFNVIQPVLLNVNFFFFILFLDLSLSLSVSWFFSV